MTRFFIVLLIACIGLQAHADEKILSFHSDIQVAADGSMQVSETITVNAEGDRIQRGIYRDFPTDYADRYGNRVKVAFEPQEVSRDGRPEPWHSERLSNGTRVYFGSADVYLDSGEHTYVFRYRTTRQLGFFEDHDELYWNVTGNGWEFTIDQASASISLPATVLPEQIKLEAYTGLQGGKGRNYESKLDSDGRGQFVTTRALGPAQGLTIVESFPKGVVQPPDSGQKLRWFVEDNRREGVLGTGLLVMLGFLYLQWRRVGRDPQGSVVIPEYDPPAGISPAAARYVRNMGYDDRCFAADLVELGVEGRLRIEKTAKAYSIREVTGARAQTPDSARVLFDELLSGYRQELQFSQSNHGIIGKARSSHESHLKTNYANANFSLNTGVGCLAGLWAIAAIVLAFVLDPPEVVPFAIFATVAVFILASIFGTVLLGWIKDIREGKRPIASSIGLIVLGAMLVGAVFVLGMLTSIVCGVLVALMVSVQIPFAQWMKAPTVEGKKLLDRIEGLRLYLGVAERDELARAKAPPMDAAEYQRLFPYALALDVEKTWGDKLAEAIGPAAAAAAAAGMAWYSHNQSSQGFDPGSFGSSLSSSLSSAISSSASPPGSSSGSSGGGGGGGSSGGGGGGGGGGGW